jgi:hypothetical protein
MTNEYEHKIEVPTANRLTWALLIVITMLLLCGHFLKQCTTPQPNLQSSISHIQKDTLQYCYYECTLENVYSEIMKADIKFSEIVLRQAILETGYFTSYNCTKRNNLFGMTGGEKNEYNTHGYKVFDHWTKSVHDYKDWQERNYGDSDLEYYSFLESIGYAESTEYISKLKSIKLIIVKQ